MAKKSKRSVVQRRKLNDDSKLFAFLATFLGIIGFVIALLVKRDDKYVMHYAKQSLIIFVLFVISGVIMIVPFFGWLAGSILYVVSVALWFVSWIYSLSGEFKDIPLISTYSKKIDL